MLQVRLPVQGVRFIERILRERERGREKMREFLISSCSLLQGNYWISYTQHWITHETLSNAIVRVIGIENQKKR